MRRTDVDTGDGREGEGRCVCKNEKDIPGMGQEKGNGP